TLASARSVEARLGIVVNMAPPPKAGAAACQRPAEGPPRSLPMRPACLGTVPRDEAGTRAGLRPRPFAPALPTAPACRAATALAARLVGQPQPEAGGVATMRQRILRMLR